MDPTTLSLFRVYSMLHSHLSSRSSQFSKNIQTHFRKATIPNLTWEGVTNGVCWYHELGTTLDNVLKEELLVAWWKAAAELFVVPTEAKIATSDSGSSLDSDDDLDPLTLECLNILWAIVRLANAGEMPSGVLHASGSQRARSSMNPQRAHAQAVAKQPSGDQMEHRDMAPNGLEEVKALTGVQWLAVLWLHVKHMVTQIFCLFIVLSVALIWIPASSQHIYIDVELTRIISDLGTDLKHLDDIKRRRLAECLEKRYALCHINRRNVMWKELPWARVTSVVKEPPPSNPSLAMEEEFGLIKVFLEGRGTSSTTVSDFQQHILQRIELQAKLVERVWLGSAVKISTEIKHRLSLVWAAFRNDLYDAFAPDMTMDEVLHELCLHGCKNITPYLNRSMSGDFPVARGGFGTSIVEHSMME